jgi:hypothetical protein
MEKTTTEGHKIDFNHVWKARCGWQNPEQIQPVDLSRTSSECYSTVQPVPGKKASWLAGNQKMSQINLPTRKMKETIIQI